MRCWLLFIKSITGEASSALGADFVYLLLFNTFEF